MINTIIFFLALLIVLTITILFKVNETLNRSEWFEDMIVSFTKRREVGTDDEIFKEQTKNMLGGHRE